MSFSANISSPLQLQAHANQTCAQLEDNHWGRKYKRKSVGNPKYRTVSNVEKKRITEILARIQRAT